MAKRNKEAKDVKKENGEESGNHIMSILFIILTIVVWLVIFCLLVRFDVNGFGSNVMRPVFKNVPIINKILPPASIEEIAEENDYPYKSYEEAIARIAELEQQVSAYQEKESTDTKTISEYQQEIARLRQFEANQTAFEAEKESYYEEVVLGNGDTAITDFTKWFENMDQATAEKIYKQVQEEKLQNQLSEDYIKSFTDMKPAQAAAIFKEMTGDLDTVVKILAGMKPDKRGEILSAIAQSDAVLAAKISLLLEP